METKIRKNKIKHETLTNAIAMRVCVFVDTLEIFTYICVG